MGKQKFLFMLVVGSLILISNQSIQGQNESKMTDSQMAKSLDLAGNLSLLNLLGKQPEYIQALYRAAFEAFSRGPNITYAQIASDKKVQQIGGRSGPPVTDPAWTTQFYSISGKYASG